MKLKSVEKLEKGKVCLEIQVEKEELEVAKEKAYRKNVGKITIHGFRKGKAPRNMIERIYGKDVFVEDAINIAFPDAYEAAVKESGLEPVSQPEVELTGIDDNGFGVKATITVKPEVELGKYKGVEAEKPAVSVTKKDIDAELNSMLERNARLVTVDREAKEGDTVIIDFEGFVDGVAFDGGKGENYSLKLGSKQFVPGFEDQLIGKKAEDEVDVNITFPKDYHEELAGKDATFKVKIHEVKETELPTADDEFAKDVSEFETLAELRKSIEAKLRDARERMSNEAFEEALLDKIADDMKVEIPDVMIEHQLDNICNDFANRLSAQGITLEQYLEMMKSDVETFRKNFRDNAEKQVKIQLALEAVAKAEGIEPTDEDVEAEYKKLSDMYGMEVEKLRGFIPAESMKSDLFTIKAREFIRDNAVAKAPEKKTTAKKTAEKKADGEKKTTAKKSAAKKTDANDAEKKPASKSSATKTAEKKPAASKKTTAKTSAKKEVKE